MTSFVESFSDSIGWLEDLIHMFDLIVGLARQLNERSNDATVDSTGWKIWHVWFVQPVWNNRLENRSQLMQPLIQLLDQPVLTTGWSNSWIV